MPTEGATQKGRRSPDPQRDAVRVVVRFIEAFNNRDADALLELLGDEVVSHTYFGHQPINPEALARAIKGMWQSFPDWYERIEEIVPGEDGTMVLRHTGRGTQAETYMGREPDGKQIAAPLITVLRIENNKIVEHRSSFPFTRPWDEPIIAGKDVQEVRAEQGGFDVDERAWSSTLQEVAEGRVAAGSLAARKADLPEESARCQSLLEENMRRCQNTAIAGSLYCSIHQEPGKLGGYGAE